METVGIVYGLGLQIQQRLGIFYGHLVYFVVIWYIFVGLVLGMQKNLATLLTSILWLLRNPGGKILLILHLCTLVNNRKRCQSTNVVIEGTFRTSIN
jgi:hypothetical protein